jgi:hypothetical protein
MAWVSSTGRVGIAYGPIAGPANCFTYVEPLDVPFSVEYAAVWKLSGGLLLVAATGDSQLALGQAEVIPKKGC